MRFHSTKVRREYLFSIQLILVIILSVDLSVALQENQAFVGCSGPSFSSTLFHRTGKPAISMAASDFNGDGKVDLAMVGGCSADSDSQEVTVLIGNGDGTFKRAVGYQAGGCPRSIVAGDFDGDGAQDLATANWKSNSIAILLGKGDGSFRSAVNITAGAGPIFITSGDLNSDGRIDLIAANSESSSVSVLIGNGDGTFRPPISYVTGGDHSSIAVADFNADGKADLALTDRASRTVSIWIGDGDGTFKSSFGYLIAGDPKSVAVSNLNGDGAPDLVVAGGSSVFVMTGKGNGSFNPPVSYVTGNANLEEIIVDDINGDGQQDVAVAGDLISFLPGNGNGSLGMASNTEVGGHSNSIASSDLNGDGKRDLTAAVGQPDGGAVVLLGLREGSFRSGQSYATGADPRLISIADFNRDGLQDFAVANYGANTISVFLGKETGGHEAAVDYAVGRNPKALIAADLNGDNKSDLVVGNTGLNNISVLLGQGDGKFQKASSCDAGLSPIAMAIGDFNGDSFPDIAITNYDAAGKIAILLGVGNGSLQLFSIFDAGSSPGPITIQDFNSDGIPDLAVVYPTESKNNVRIYLGKGDGTFQNAIISSSEPYPDSIVASDFNADGKMDLALRCLQKDQRITIATLLGSGNGTFYTRSSLALGIGETGGFADLAAASLNGDSAADLVVITGSARQYVTVALGRGDGTFYELGSYPLGNGLNAIAMGDLNGDYKYDLTVSGSAGYVIVALNACGLYPSGCPGIWPVPMAFPGGKVGVAYSQSMSATGGTAPYAFAVTSGSLPPGLILGRSGILGGTPSAKGTFQFVVTAVDANFCIGSRAYSLTITGKVCPTITLIPISVPNGILGVPYSQGLLAVGGTGSYQYTVLSGTLPIGLSVLRGGAISGTPTSLGNYSFTIRAVDDEGCMGTQDYSINISATTSLGEMVSPPPSSTLSATWATFRWAGGTGVVQYWLNVGRTPGGYDIYNRDQNIKLSATVLGLPNDGSTIYARLWSKTDQGWKYADYAYVTCSGCLSGYSAAQMIIPTPGSILVSTNVTFGWNAGAGVSQYWLYVSKTAGGSEIYNQEQGTDLTTAVPGLPVDGNLLYVRLWSLVGETWIYNDYTYKACTGCAPVGIPAEIISPEAGSIFQSSTIIFNWNSGTGVSRYQLYVGRIIGRKDLYAKNEGTRLSTKVTGLPNDGSPVFARLWSLIGDSWVYKDYAYKSCNACVTPAELKTPIPGQGLPAPTVTFSWDAGTGATRYKLIVGRTPGGEDFFGSEGTALSMTVTELPENGSAVYVRLSSLLPATAGIPAGSSPSQTQYIWRSIDYLFIASLGSSQIAELVQPMPGSSLSNANAQFSWSAGAGVLRYRLTVGKNLGGNEIYDGDQGTSLGLSLNNMPLNGQPIYVRLSSLVGTTWRYNDYILLAASTDGR